MSATGGLFCVYYIFKNFIFKSKGGLYIKGNAYLILDVDAIGEKLEYYVRKIENDISDRYIYINQIILYSKTLSRPCESCAADGETFKICRILSESYGNIIFLNNNNINNPAENILDIVKKIENSRNI